MQPTTGGTHQRGNREDLLIHVRFPAVLCTLAGVLFVLVGVLFTAPLAVQWDHFVWPPKWWLLALVGLGAVFVVAGLWLLFVVFRYLVHGKGPPVVALRAEAIIDYRTDPPVTLPWQEIEDVDVVFCSESQHVKEKRVIVSLAGGRRHELDLLDLDVNVWKFKLLVRERIREARGVAPSAETTAPDLGSLMAAFPSRPWPVLLLLGTLIFFAFITAVVAFQDRNGPLLLCALATAIVSGVLCGLVWYRSRGRIQVYDHGVVFRGVMFTHTYFFGDIAGALVYSVNGIPEAVTLRLREGKKVVLPTAGDQVGKLCDLINSRV
jgi:hypothetical protein